jgi:hypothetical protein
MTPRVASLFDDFAPSSSVVQPRPNSGTSPELPPASGSTVLVSQIAYKNRGEAYLSIDPKPGGVEVLQNANGYSAAD